MVKKSEILTPGLRRYFYSGWAFLMPYLFVYLLYYVTKWPVNPAISNQRPEAGSQIIVGSWVPCMLYVYWALHAAHAILAGFALWSWWAHERAKVQGPSAKCQDSDRTSPAAKIISQEEIENTENDRPTSAQLSSLSPAQTDSECVPSASISKNQWLKNADLQPPASGIYPLSATRYSLLTALAPWLLLALIFYIPGVYLEWPSDPWEHLRRINEWRILDTVGAHSSWLKSAYFIPYSLLSWCIGLRQLFWLDFYYTGICLLLCWQYYRFSRACGLGERASMVFVIIQALLFGNNIFSFYRYYGISSSIYAQLGAVALTRIVLEFASRGTKLGTILQEGTEGTETGSTSALLPPLYPVQTKNCSDPFNAKAAKDDLQTQSPQSKPSPYSLLAPRTPPELADRPLAPGAESAPQPFGPLSIHRICSLLATRYSLLLSIPCLLALTAMNHPQGLGIAGLGIAAVSVWRLIEWKRSALWWLIAGTLVVNALFLWLYPRPAIIETYRAQGYLNAWYGFNILDLSSPAGDRMLQIVSAFGLVNLVAALFFLRRNHAIAWLTLAPFLVLLLPCIGIPFANVLSKHGDLSSIITFQRMLFAIPTGLVLTYLVSCMSETPSPRILATVVLAATLAIVLILPPNSPRYNRSWHTLFQTPKDLQMKHVLAAFHSATPSSTPEARIYSSHSVGATLQAAGISNIVYAWRTINWPASDLATSIIAAVNTNANRGTLLFIPTSLDLYTPTSLSGQLSTHWLGQEVPVSFATGSELTTVALKTGASKIPTPTGSLYRLGNPTSIQQ